MIWVTITVPLRKHDPKLKGLWHDVFIKSFILSLPWRCHDLNTLSALLSFCERYPPSLVNSPHKWPVMRNFDASPVVSLYKLLRSVIDVTKSRSSHLKDVRWNVMLQTMWQYVFSCEKSSRFNAFSWRKYILVRLTTLYKNMSWKHNPTGMW